MLFILSSNQYWKESVHQRHSATFFKIILRNNYLYLANVKLFSYFFFVLIKVRHVLKWETFAIRFNSKDLLSHLSFVRRNVWNIIASENDYVTVWVMLMLLYLTMSAKIKRIIFFSSSLFNRREHHVCIFQIIDRPLIYFCTCFRSIFIGSSFAFTNEFLACLNNRAQAICSMLTAEIFLKFSIFKCSSEFGKSSSFTGFPKNAKTASLKIPSSEESYLHRT